MPDQGAEKGVTVPSPSSLLDVQVDDRVTIRVRRHGNPEGPRIMTTHGCGLAADTYFPFWKSLLDRYDLILFDLRSHGWNPVSDQRAHNIHTFANDYAVILRAVGQRFGEKPTAGVFHSVSALIALVCQQMHSGFAGLVLLDPPVCPPGKEASDMEPITRRLAESTLRRKDRFESREDYTAAIAGNPAFARLHPDVPGLMAETLLRPAADGEGYELRCPREYEAQIYQWSFGWSMQVDLSRVRCPVKAIGSDPTTNLMAFMPSTDLSELSVLGYDFLPDTTHLLQLETPEHCAALTVEAIETWDLAG